MANIDVLKRVLPIPHGYELLEVKNNTMYLKKVEE